MNSLKLINLAALISILTALAVLVVLVPENNWTPTTIVSGLIFIVSIGYNIFIPASIARRNNSAVPLASIGPLTFQTLVFFLFSTGAFIFALNGNDKLAWTLDILGCGFFLISWLVINSALGIIEDITINNSQPSIHLKWKDELSSLTACTRNSENTLLLTELLEVIRYSASQTANNTPYDNQIDAVIVKISNIISLSEDGSIQENINKIKTLLIQRDIAIRSARSVA